MRITIKFPRKKFGKIYYVSVDFDVDISNCKDVECIVEKVAYELAEQWCSGYEKCDVDAIAYAHFSWLYDAILPHLQEIAMKYFEKKMKRRGD